MAPRMSAGERYERGRVLKHANMYDQAIDDFQHAAQVPEFAGQAQAQMARCFRAMGRHEEAVAAYRQALGSSTLSSSENLQMLYLLGRSLESLGRTAEALEIYGRVRQEDAGFRDVASRIKHLCAGGRGFMPQSLLVRQFRMGDLFTIYGHLKQRSLSLLGHTRQAFTQSPRHGRPVQRVPHEDTTARHTNSGDNRPLMARRDRIVMRQHVRVAIHGRSKFHSKSQKMAGEGQLRDLSPGGCRVRSSVLVPVGAKLVCWIFPQNDAHPVAIEGATVRWSHAQEFGLAFTHVQPAAQRQLAQLCASPVA
jgi:PilZ domain/Tetratricopeptide repeat